MRRFAFRGFTLVELLVVIAIIGILVSLSLTGLSAAIARARQAQCQSRIRALAVAVASFELKRSEYPGHCQFFGKFSGGVDPGDPSNFDGNVPEHLKIGGWPITLLSELDAQPHFERWSFDRYPLIADQNSSRPPSAEGYSVFASPNLEQFECPSATNRLANRGINQFVANTGMHPITLPFSYTRPGQAERTVTFETSIDRANGIFTNRYAGFDPSDPATLVPTGKSVRSTDISDGLSATILLSENHQALPIHLTAISGNADHLRQIEVIDGREVIAYPSESRYLQGTVWHFEDPEGFAGAPAVNSLHLINGGDEAQLDMTSANFTDVSRPSSLHFGGAHAAMADSSARFLTDQIDYRVYQALMTPQTRSSDIPMNESLPVELL